MLHRHTALLLGWGLLLAACAPTTTKIGKTEITSAEMLSSYRESESAAQDLREARYAEALARAEHAVALSPDNGWAWYDRAAALHHLGRVDAAVDAYREAERRFDETQRAGRSIAIYGRARVLADSGRCGEAIAAYGEFSAYVRASDPRAAEMALAYAKDCRPTETPIGDPAMMALVTDLIAGRPAGALAQADQVGAAARDSGWLDYNRAAALSALARTDDAVAAYRAAERVFGQANPHARAIAIYGRARALDDAGRCSEASRAYTEYADAVRASDAAAAEMALTYARACRAR